MVISSAKTGTTIAMASSEIAVLQEQMRVHVANFERHEQEELKRHTEAKETQQANTDKIDELCRSTQSLVEAWEALGGAVKLGTWLGRLIKWFSGIAIVSTALSWLAKGFSG